MKQVEAVIDFVEEQGLRKEMERELEIEMKEEMEN